MRKDVRLLGSNFKWAGSPYHYLGGHALFVSDVLSSLYCKRARIGVCHLTAPALRPSHKDDCESNPAKLTTKSGCIHSCRVHIGDHGESPEPDVILTC